MEHLISLTPGKYEIDTYDSQPIGGFNSPTMMLFVITGRVKYNENDNLMREFYHEFILQQPDQQKFYILSENFRLLK